MAFSSSSRTVGADTLLQAPDDEDAGRGQGAAAVPKQSPAEKVADGGCGRRVSMVRFYLFFSRGDRVAVSSFLTHLLFLVLFRDRRKLTFYFVADKRIDFRELVRELFRCALGLFEILCGVTHPLQRLYKTRIWMASLQGPAGYEQ